MNKIAGLVTLIIALGFSVSPSYADQGGFTNSGGSGSGGSGVYVSSSVANPAGTLTVNCPATGAGGCAGGSYSFATTDGSVTINATLTTGTASESCAGGGRGGRITCGYSLSASFSGTLTSNGAPQAVVGTTSQSFIVGKSPTGISSYNSAYSPFYYSDSEQILRSDDLLGTNQIVYGSGGSGVGQFYGAYGIALDSAGRIYVADTYNCRVVRIDDMNGTNWTTFGGTCGSDQGEFYDPMGIAVDSTTGRIYIMDTGNSRLVSIDDMNGTNWTVFNNVGSGDGQVSTFTAVALDAAGRIYIPDSGNNRIVRMDDMNGTNWVALTQSQPVNGVTYSFSSPAAVAVDSAGRIYVADNGSYAPEVVRVDDIAGANWTSLYVSPSGSTGLNSIAVDASGAAFTGGGGAKIIDNMSGVLTSSGAVAPYGTYYVFGVTPLPISSPPPSAISLTPTTLNFSQNVGTTSPAQTITLANFGGNPLNFSGISVSGGFAETDNCPSRLPGGSNCTVSVTFSPSVTGAANGTLTVNDDSYNAGTSQTATLNGTGTAPVATVTPTSLSFSSQVEGTTSAARTVTLQNSGTGPMQVTSVTATAPFNQTNTCSGTIGAGSSCTIGVTFSPMSIGPFTGTLTINDNAGTQTLSLSGTGSSPTNLSTSSLNFGTVAVGNTSAVKSVTLTNRQNIPLNLAGIGVTGPFAIAGNTCGTSIAGGASCSVGVTFTPTSISSFTGTLTFTDDALNSPQIVSLSGTGSAPTTVSSGSLSFGTVVLGSTSSTKSVTITNRQNTALTFSGIGVTAPFAIAGKTCGATLAAGAGCSVGVTFIPTAVGSAGGKLTFTDDAGNSPQTVSLSGTGGAPLSFSTTTLSFGTVKVGTTSSAKSVTVTNRTAAAVSFSTIAAGANFNVSTNGCGAGLAVGAKCTVGVTFSPSVVGTVNGTLTFSDSTLTSPQTVNLAGAGQ